MKTTARLACLAALTGLTACAGSPPVRHLTLDDGPPPRVHTLATPAIAVGRASLPERIDRAQLVLHTGGQQVTLSEQYRWAEPLRHEIPRLIARDLGELLDSRRVAALPAGTAGFDADFQLAFEFQQLDAIVGQGVDVDVLWRLEARSGRATLGRSSFRQPLEGRAADPADPAGLVAAQRQALRRIAAEIAAEIAAQPKP